ncbi:MAG: hypothetical protein C0601_06005 [Candidatus Muiribacterium halophilum]|uniref:STAS domain-containing protein n=1 Tax=Muiribacterium halophilum TaxID=2053465 RepID=A0A2N5ZGV7_MUIH1|nr:MAG: hypothetical protein C0601_06005 [Candidatus Muirbacterium halophilum]
MYDFIVLENYLFISISKDLVFGSNDSLESFIEIRLNSDIKGVVLNLTNTTYIDSSGVSHILRIKKMIDLSLKSLFIVVDNPRIEKVLKISRIDKYINIYKNNQDVFDFNKTDDIEPGQKVYEYNMAIPGEFKYIQLVESFLKNILEKHYVFKDKDKYDINMYLEESLSNSIEHGYEESGLKGKISILVICRKT